MLKLKVHIRNKKKSRNTANAITAHENMQNIEVGRNITIGENSNQRYQKYTWIDKVNNLLWARKLQLKSPTTKKKAAAVSPKKAPTSPTKKKAPISPSKATSPTKKKKPIVVTSTTKAKVAKKKETAERERERENEVQPSLVFQPTTS